MDGLAEAPPSFLHTELVSAISTPLLCLLPIDAKRSYFSDRIAHAPVDCESRHDLLMLSEWQFAAVASTLPSETVSDFLRSAFCDVTE